MPRRTAKDYDIAGCNCSALRKAARRVSLFYDRRILPSGIRADQFSMLVVIARLGDASVGAVGEALGLDRTTAGSNLRSLERMGLVEIGLSSQDSRRRSIKLTRAGRNRIKAALPLWLRAQAEFETMNGAELTGMLRDNLGGMKA
jgi:DNA-binding MarR family transcriptional regulator